MADWGASYRKVIKEGFILRRAQGFLSFERWKQYWCRVSFKAVAITTSEQEKGIDPKKYFFVDAKLGVKHEPYRPEADKHSRQFMLRVYNDKKFMMLAASSQAEAEAWVNAIQFAIDSFRKYGQHPPSRPQLLTHVPVPTVQTTAPHHPHQYPPQQGYYPPHQPPPSGGGNGNGGGNRNSFDQRSSVTPPPPQLGASANQAYPPPPHQQLFPQHPNLQQQQQQQQFQHARHQQQWQQAQPQQQQARARPQPSAPAPSQQPSPAQMHDELMRLAAASTNAGNSGITREQYLAMQHRIATLTEELKKYKYRYEQDSNAVDQRETRRHQRHDKGSKHTF